MKTETDDNGKVLPLVIPTQEEFAAWIESKGFTHVSDLLEGYAILTNARKKAIQLEDPEFLVADVIISAEDEIEEDLFNLFVCAFRDFAAKQSAG